MTFSVQLEVFEGPLDLLLSLVSKERVDVAEVSISTITDDYLTAVRAMGEIDIDSASAFLVLAATLLELKSIKLLPKKDRSDPELAAALEERDRLVHRLIEYATFKNAGTQLSRLFEVNKDLFSRTPQIPPELMPALPDILEGVTPDMLRAAAEKVFLPRPLPEVDTSHVTPIRVSVRETVEILAEQIRTAGAASFRELCADAIRRIDTIVRFLALLELFKSQSVDLEQERPFGEIVVRWREPHRRAS